MKRVRADGRRDRVLDCRCSNQRGETVAAGEAVVRAPTEKVRRPRSLLPEVHFHSRGARFAQLVARARQHPAIRTAVVHPCDEVSLAGALEAAAEGLIVPLLVGPAARSRAGRAARSPFSLRMCGPRSRSRPPGSFPAVDLG